MSADFDRIKRNIRDAHEIAEKLRRGNIPATTVPRRIKELEDLLSRTRRLVADAESEYDRERRRRRELED